MQAFSLYTTVSIANYPSTSPIDPHQPEIDRKVAEGILFDDGICILKYLRFIKQPHVFQSIADLEKVIGRDGRSRIVLGDAVQSSTIPAHSGL